MTQRFTIPLGPSINSYYTGKERRFVSNLGKKFRRRAIEVMREQGVQRMGGRLSVVLLIHFAPGRRLNDLDNRCKAALDAMQKGGAYHDDSQIDRLLVDRGAAVDGGKIEVTIVRLT